MNRNDKRAAICRLAFLPIGKATVKEHPGEMVTKVNGVFTDIPISSGEFRETQEPGNAVEQELEAVVTGTGHAFVQGLRRMLAEYGLLLLTLTNGEQRVVGSMEFPVLVSITLSGSPATLTLSFKRTSPEPSKEYSSF